MSRGVLLQKSIPSMVCLCTLGSHGVIHVIDCLRNIKVLIRVEPKGFLELDNVIGLERRSVDLFGALVQRTESNGGKDLDQRGLILDLLSLLNGVCNARKIIVSILDHLDMPSIGLEALGDIFCESH